VRPGGGVAAVRKDWDDLDVRTRSRFRAWLQVLADEARLQSGDSWKKVPGWKHVWQLRKDQYRLLACYKSPGQLVIVAIEHKTSRKLDAGTFERAERIFGEDIGYEA
jgi:mRNA-degrading endonuclease RelE of RelBE toxin-antitoxin system